MTGSEGQLDALHAESFAVREGARKAAIDPDVMDLRERATSSWTSFA
jgi:hypothetical protein